MPTASVGSSFPLALPQSSGTQVTPQMLIAAAPPRFLFHQLSVIALGSPGIGSVSICHLVDVICHINTLAPPSIDSMLS